MFTEKGGGGGTTPTTPHTQSNVSFILLSNGDGTTKFSAERNKILIFVIFLLDLDPLKRPG